MSSCQKLILLHPYVGWIKIKTYNPPNFSSPYDNTFLAVTENKLIVWNHHFSGPTSINLFKFSKINSRMMCKKCSKLKIEALDVVLVTSVLTVNIFYTLFFFLWLGTCKFVDRILYCLNLNLPRNFRVGSKSAITIKTKLCVLTVNNTFSHYLYFITNCSTLDVAKVWKLLQIEKIQKNSLRHCEQSPWFRDVKHSSS